MNILRFPLDQDCHEMWSKKRKRILAEQATGGVIGVAGGGGGGGSLSSNSNGSNSGKVNVANSLFNHTASIPLNSLDPSSSSSSSSNNLIVNTSNLLNLNSANSLSNSANTIHSNANSNQTVLSGKI